jgi:hypothetical protein
MYKETLSKLVNTLKENSIDFKLDTYIHKGKSYLRGIFIYKPESEDGIKRVLDRSMLDYFEFKKAYSWYLGDRVKTLVLRPKEELELEIPDIERYGISNYA